MHVGDQRIWVSGRVVGLLPPSLPLSLSLSLSLSCGVAKNWESEHESMKPTSSRGQRTKDDRVSTEEHLA
jgi:hypothetical protein